MLVKGLLVISWFMAFMAAGCKEEDPYIITCKDGPVGFQEPKDMDLFSFMNVKEDDKFIKRVIQSQIELERYVDLTRITPKINFKEKTFLAGRVYSSQLANLIRQEITSNCNRNEITYRITLQYHQFLPESGYTQFFATIPKISDKTRVNVIIDYEN